VNEYADTGSKTNSSSAYLNKVFARFFDLTIEAIRALLLFGR
jgi:hypothetical protein